ncbi:MAG TPA: hypothetical protein VH331_17595 [Allosphingosinicella sp.]|nr:hypothetical protein [Allosphingosinicella sp.]
MSDVEIVFPKGREAAVRRLHDALAEAGYDVGSREMGEGDRTSADKDASAVLILWDRSTMAHPGLQAVAAAARSRDRAIDVSVDGITPLDLDDDRKLVHLSGWRGDAHHPGWRKILARLDELCARRAAPLPRLAAAPSGTETRAPAGGKGDARPARSAGAGRALLAAAAGILVVALALAALLMSRGPQGPRPQSPPPPAAPPAAAPAEQLATSGETAQPAPAPAAPGSSSQPAPVAAGEAAVPPAAQSPEASQAAPVAATGAPAPEKARSPKSGHERHRPAIHYTRYSKTMRLFCERAGRGTPQCRLFHEATQP